MSKHLKDGQIDRLFQGMLKLETVEECYQFFEDLCTISEIKAMAQRFEVAFMLDDQRVYTEIEQQTGASSATISRVNKCLLYGEDGYQLVLKRLKGENV